jgi:hypothetical protein
VEESIKIDLTALARKGPYLAWYGDNSSIFSCNEDFAFYKAGFLLEHLGPHSCLQLGPLYVNEVCTRIEIWTLLFLTELAPV